MPNSEQEWDIFAIKAEVHRRGMTLTGIAEDAGLERSACRRSLRGDSRAGAEAIAAALGIPFRTLFPKMYLRGHNRAANLALKTTGKESAKTRKASDNLDVSA